MKKNLLFALTIHFIITSCQTSAEKSLEVVPPFENITMEGSSMTIDPSIQQVVKFENGVSVEIPKDAFTDITGEIISKKVTLSIKTFNTAAQIIASGIPMTYTHEGIESIFESAGMFQISGESFGVPILIKEGKELEITYPSNVYGDYDFFHFEEESNAKGNWEKLSDIEKQTIDSSKVIDTFKLQFAIEDYPELTPISEIKWNLATSQGNPKSDKNKWVLDEKWSSIEISQPQYGFGDPLFTDPVNYDGYLVSGAILAIEDGSRIITSDKPFTKIWDRSGRLLKTIDKVRDTYNPVEIITNKYLVVQRMGGDYIYDLDGNLICKIDKSYDRHIIPSKERIIYNVYGMGHVKIKDFKGTTLRDIQLSIGHSNYNLNQVYEHFIFTPQDELISNSLDGIIFYDLNGNKVKQRDGNYRSIEYLTSNTLLIEELDGNLLIWDYEKNIDKKSQPNSFDLRTKQIKNTRHHSTINYIMDTDYILINEANEDQSKLWNYELNKTTNLPFSAHHSPWDSLPPNLIAGYNYQDTTFHLYDIIEKKDIITIPNLNPGFNNDLSSYHISVSKDEKHILINSSSHAHFYSLDGQLIKDFKQFDSLISLSGFISDSTLFTLSENGVYRIWNMSGTQISSALLKNEEPIYGWRYLEKVMTYSQILNNSNYYNLSGDLMLSLGKTRINKLIDSTHVICLDHNKSAVLKKLFQLETSIYQLLLRKGETEFITYVYLDDNDLQTIDKYYAYRAKRINNELDRQGEELKAIRRFKLNNFGIYNWDKLINESGRIFFAASFEFDIPVDFNKITIFHVTQINGRVVVKYDQTGSNNFTFNPNSSNKLVAILPDNKIALFDNDEFKAINIDQISEERSFVFSMKTVNEPISSLLDLESKIE